MGTRTPRQKETNALMYESMVEFSKSILWRYVASQGLNKL